MIIISIVSFIMSTITWLLVIYRNRFRLDFNVLDFRLLANQFFQVYILIQNNSQIPVSVTEVEMIVNDKAYPCELHPKCLRTDPTHGDLYSVQLPLYLEPYQGIYCYLEFLHAQDIPLTPRSQVFFVVHTNRRNLRKLIILPEQGRGFRAGNRRNLPNMNKKP